MKTFFIVISIIFQIGCASLQGIKGQVQPVKLLDSKTKIYMTTCSGMAETIGSCYQKAQKTCDKGYRLTEEKIDSSGINRLIKFQCKI